MDIVMADSGVFLAFVNLVVVIVIILINLLVTVSVKWSRC